MRAPAQDQGPETRCRPPRHRSVVDRRLGSFARPCRSQRRCRRCRRCCRRLQQGRMDCGDSYRELTQFDLKPLGAVGVRQPRRQRAGPRESGRILRRGRNHHAGRGSAQRLAPAARSELLRLLQRLSRWSRCSASRFDLEDGNLAVQFLEAVLAHAAPAVQTSPRALVSDDEVPTPLARPQARGCASRNRFSDIAHTSIQGCVQIRPLASSRFSPAGGRWAF